MSVFRNKISELDLKTRDALHKIVRSRNISVAMYRRATAILLVADGHGPSEVARRAGLDRANVFRWVRRFLNEGVRGLEDMPRRRKRSSAVVAAPVLNTPAPAIESSFAATVRNILARNASCGDE